MSAQAGIWNFEGRPVDQAFLEKLTSAIERHGPDGGDTCIDGSIGMVYRAFHTTLESRLERQPYISARGNIITWDGRLDNRDDLLPLLWHKLTADQTDVAIVAAAFELWGTDCFVRLVGDWAVAVWKPMERELILAVDYMALRHIFYYPKKDYVWWCTDLAPLVLLSGDKFCIDDEYIAGYFAHDPDGHLTPYREIREVPPGQFVRIHTGRVSVHRYWSYSPKARIRYKTDPEYEEHFRHVFRQSVRRRLRADTPVLAELSGGLDSSSIVCMADDILSNEGANAPRLDTLSYYDKTEPNGDDWIYCQKIEEKRGRIGTHIDLSKMGSSPASLEYLDFAPVPGYFGPIRQIEVERSAAVRNGRYRVVLSGLGGDEFLGGMPDPLPHLADLIVQLKMVRLAKQLMAWSLVKRRPWVQLLWEASVSLLPSRLGQYLAKDAKVEPWIERDFANRTRLSIRQLGVDEHFGLRLPTRCQYIAAVLLIANKMAKHTCPGTALEEMCFPYLDQNLIEFILSIPASQLLRPGERRSLMRRSLASLVPAEVLFRRTKGISMRTPLLAMDNYWDELRAAFDSPLSSRLGYINQPRFLEKVNAVRNGRESQIIRTLKGVSLEFWLRDLQARHLINAGTFARQPLAAVSSEARA